MNSNRDLSKYQSPAAPEAAEQTSSAEAKAAARRSALGRLFRFSLKELLEILRDRRTIVTLVLMPLLVYPLLGLIVQKFMLSSLTQAGQTVYLVACETTEDVVVLEQFLGLGEAILSRSENNGKAADEAGAEGKAEADGLPTSEEELAELLAGRADRPTVRLLVNESPDRNLESIVADNEADIGVRILNREAIELMRAGRPGTIRFEVVERESSPLSEDAREFVSRRLRAVNDSWIRNFLRQRRVRLKFPNEMETKTVGSTESQPPALLTFIPLMLVLMTMTGAVYPAIDLTAGERERGTMEILMAAPVSRMALLFGKFIAVLAVAMLTALINLLAMLVTMYTLGLESIIFGEQGVSPTVIFTILGLLLVFAAFFSAVLLGLTSFARSFKEAQAYLIPVMLVALAPALLSLFPNVQMSIGLAVVPLLNIVLLGRDLLSASPEPTLVAVTVISTVLYGLLALGIAARVFGADSMLFGGSRSWSDFFHRSGQSHPVPSMPTAMLLLAVLFPAFVIAGGIASRFETSIVNRLWINAGITALLFVVLPLIFSVWFQLKPQSSFLLYPPRWAAVVMAVLLGVSVWTIAYEIEVFSLTRERLDFLREIFGRMKVELQQIPLPIKLFCLAVTPAICEEFTFRGFLMSAFRSKMSTVAAVIGTSVLFGLFHVFVRDSLLFERMLPSTLMGLLLGIVCVRTGSVIPGMILHTLHNGWLITLAHFESQLQEWGIGVTEQQHLPVTWLALAAVPILLGAILLLRGPIGRKPVRNSQPDSSPTVSKDVDKASSPTDSFEKIS